MTSWLRGPAQAVLGGFLVLAGTAHLTVAREEFRAQVPPWVPLDVDLVVADGRDAADQAAVGDDLVALLERRDHVAVLAQLLLLRTQDQEIHDRKHQQQRDELRESGGSAGGGCLGVGGGHEHRRSFVGGLRKPGRRNAAEAGGSGGLARKLATGSGDVQKRAALDRLPRPAVGRRAMRSRTPCESSNAKAPLSRSLRHCSLNWRIRTCSRSSCRCRWRRCLPSRPPPRRGCPSPRARRPA